jgi:hypothetical protein
LLNKGYLGGVSPLSDILYDNLLCYPQPGVTKRQDSDKLGASETNLSKLACPYAVTSNIKLSKIIGNPFCIRFGTVPAMFIEPVVRKLYLGLKPKEIE